MSEPLTAEVPVLDRSGITIDPPIQPAAYHETSVDSLDTQAIDPTMLAQPLTFAKLISEADLPIGQGSGSDEVLTPTEPSTDLAELESIAQSSHPELQQALARIEEARGQSVQAGLPYNPVLQYQSDEIASGSSSGLHAISLSQQFVTANKLGIAQQEQLQVVQRRTAEYEISRLRILTGVRSAFAEMVIAQDRVVITDSIAKLAKRSADTVLSLLEAEEVSRIAYLQARVEAERAQLLAQNAVATLDQKRRALAASVGIPTLPTNSVFGEPPEQLSPQPWQSLVDELSSLSPQVASATSGLDRARWALRLACAQVTPDVTGRLGVGYAAGVDDVFAVVGVSVPLPIRNRNEGNIRAARASISAASANIDRTQLQLQKALADAVGRYEVARQTYQRLRQEISPDAKEAFELARKAFESGEADYLQVLTAQRTWFDTRLAAINALQTAKTADAEIQGALTTTVP